MINSTARTINAGIVYFLFFSLKNEAIGHLMMSYSRADELEADRLAVKYLRKAGYNPEAMGETLGKMLKWQMEGPIKTKRYWYTHPYLATRKAAVNKEVTGQIDFDDYMNMSSDDDYIFQ